jgi:hypothetical protein
LTAGRFVSEMLLCVGLAISMKHNDLEWWPRQLREIFAAIGEVMAEKRLRPEMLNEVRLPDSQFNVSHVSGKEIGQRAGYYLIAMKGGQWKLQSGMLERLSRLAAERVRQNRKQ